MENKLRIRPLSLENDIPAATVSLPASKSISNRVLVMNALCQNPLEIDNIAKCDDTDVMVKALSEEGELCDIGAAGTSMRFLTAFFSTRSGCRIITGSDRMKQRPIGILVDALNAVGADISYTENVGFPPLKINGRKLSGGELHLNGGVSSQFISALLMVAPVMQNGLVLHLDGDVISRPYIEMTLGIMQQFGIQYRWEGDTISIAPQEYQPIHYLVESDWSAASYWYEITALCEKDFTVHLPRLMQKSLQGDSMARRIFEPLGVETKFLDDIVELKHAKNPVKHYEYDFISQPDLAQTVVVTCCALGTTFRFSGLQSLKIKETDRIEALKNECRKLGFVLKEDGVGVLCWDGERVEKTAVPSISTYHDHRMAMSFAPAVLRLGEIDIENPSVVSKSYPDFWLDIACCYLFSVE